MSFRDFLAGAVIDTAEAIGATGISQTDGWVNTAINYLSPTRPQPQQRGYSQLGGFFSAPDRVPRKHAVASATYFDPTAAVEIKEGIRRGDHRFHRETPTEAPPTRAPPMPAAVAEIKEGIRRGDHRFHRETPPVPPPTRMPPKPTNPNHGRRLAKLSQELNQPSTAAVVKPPNKPPKALRKMKPPQI